MAMHTDHDDLAEDDFYEKPSKTQRKKDMHDLQSLGDDLLTLPRDRLEPLGLPEILMDAVAAAKKITNFEGKRRQMQYIGKLMRKVDPEPIREAVASFKLGHAKDALALHESEAWRARLLESDDALQQFVSEYAGTDVQQLRSLVRAARKDAALVPEKRSGRAFRELFQFIKAEALGADKTDDE
jgi:ribosome-associated protein